jgi:hypothetical protein
MAAKALNKSIDWTTYPGGASGLLSDLLFSVGYVMTRQRIRDITYQQAKRNPTVVSFSKSLK